MAIQRWDFDVWSGCEEEDSEGEFVKLADHLSDKATALDRQRGGIAMMVHVALTLTIQKHGMISREMVDDLAKDIRAYAGAGEEKNFEWQCQYCGAKLTERDKYCPCREESL